MPARHLTTFDHCVFGLFYVVFRLLFEGGSSEPI